MEKLTRVNKSFFNPQTHRNNVIRMRLIQYSHSVLMPNDYCRLNECQIIEN